jgi:opacity protein-like surface antigen
MLDLRALGLAVVLAAALCAAQAASAQAPADSAAQNTAANDQAYRVTIDDAVREFDAGHWEEARALFKRANELSPNARTLRGMGMAAFELRMYVQAIRELDAALRETRKPLAGEMRASVEQLKVKAREFVGRVQLVLEPPEAKVLVDGKEPQLEPDGTVLLDVGTHVIAATADGYKSTNLRLGVEGGMDEAVRVPLEPLLAMQTSVPAMDPDHPPPLTPEAATETKPPPKAEDSHLDTIGWITLAAAAGFGVASGVTYFVVGGSKYDHLKTTCHTQCSDQKINASGIRTMDTLSTVFLVTASAAAVTSGVLFLIYSSSEQAPAAQAEAPHVSLAVAPTGMTLRGQF